MIIIQPIKILLSPLQKFIQLEAAGGLLLLIVSVIALIWANSPLEHQYYALWHTPVIVGLGDWVYTQDLHFWINDGLMVLFFLVVGLEIKREILAGELTSMRKASLPIAAALGGMVAPAILYIMINPPGTPQNVGWGIPIATDIAFAIGILTLLGRLVPLSLKVFLIALAIVDDLGAILVIALFYSNDLSLTALGIGLSLFALLLLMNKAGIRSTLAYVFVGFLLWLAFLNSGIHATIAGVLLAFTIPTQSRITPEDFMLKGNIVLDTLKHIKDVHFLHVLSNKDYQSGVLTLGNSCRDALAPLQRIEHALHPWITFMVLPLFALANAGVSLSVTHVGPAITNPITVGIIIGLLFGKPLGITLFTWASVKSGLAVLPRQIGIKHIFAVSWLGGIGFTMSLFIASLSFGVSPALDNAKIGIIVASILAGFTGWYLLTLVFRQGLSRQSDAIFKEEAA